MGRLERCGAGSGMEQRAVPEPLAAGHRAEPISPALLERSWLCSAPLKPIDLGSVMLGAKRQPLHPEEMPALTFSSATVKNRCLPSSVVPKGLFVCVSLGTCHRDCQGACPHGNPSLGPGWAGLPKGGRKTGAGTPQPGQPTGSTDHAELLSMRAHE